MKSQQELIEEEKENCINKLKMLCAKHKYPPYGWLKELSKELKKDVELWKQISDISLRAYQRFCEMKKNKELMLHILLKPEMNSERVMNVPEKEEFISNLGNSFEKESRIGVAYDLYRVNSSIARRFAPSLIRRLNGMTIVEYVEKNNLRKSLQKNMPKNEVVKKKMKI